MDTETTAGLEGIRSKFDNVDKRLGEKIAWYKGRVWIYRTGTVFVRLAGLGAIAYGLLSPLIKPQTDYRDAYLAVVIGGIVLLVDQVFMVSLTWARFIKAQLALEAVKDHLGAQWDVLEITANPSSPVQHNEAVKLLADSLDSANAIIAGETSKWEGELEVAMKRLSDDMTSARTSIADRREKFEQAVAEEKKKVEAAREAEAQQKTPGAVNVGVLASKEALRDIEVKCGETVQKAGLLPAKFGFDALTPGQHRIEVSGTREDGTRMDKIVQIVQIKAGELAALEIKIPY